MTPMSLSSVRRAATGLASVLFAVSTVMVMIVHAPPAAAQPVARPAGPPAYWLAASDGGVFTFGGAPFAGSAGGVHLARPIVSSSATPDARGYWLMAADGGIFAYGDAPYRGSVPGLPASARPPVPFVAMATSATGNGYWEVAANGAVYSFGDAPFFGSLGGHLLAAPIVGMAGTPDGGGYWLVASDGGVFAFGDAGFFGSTGNVRLFQPIVGMAGTPDGGGYWLVASDGGVFAFGDAGFFGSTGNIKLFKPIVGVAASPDGGGYWLVASDGGIFTFGDAPFRGSTGAIRLAAPIVAIVLGVSLDPYPPGATGYDISWPQCPGALPPVPFAFDIVGVNNGRAFTHNPCLGPEHVWAAQSIASYYMNLNAPPDGDPGALTGPDGTCGATDAACRAYNYGYNAALDALHYATTQGVLAETWWLDVETANTWDADQSNNSRTIQGALDALSNAGVQAGIYSTPHQFGIIAGAFRPGVPVWVATGADFATAVSFCDPSHSFGGGRIFLTQYGDSTGFDRDYACPGV
jgi:hypothetical protein